MSRSKAVIHPTVLAVFKDSVRKLSDTKLDNLIERVQDVVPEEQIGIRELPVVVPEIVRRVLSAKSKQVAALIQEIEDTLGTLETVAETEMDRREREAEAALPHCDKCGAVLQPKRRK